MRGRSLIKAVFWVLMAALMLLTGSLIAGSARNPAPKFELKDLNGQTASLSSYRGKTVLINFWATWCVPCLKEIPDLVRLQNSMIMNKKPFTVIGVAVASGDPRDIMKFAKDHGMNYPILLDPYQEVYKNYRVFGLPASFLIDPKGMIAKSYAGPQTYGRLISDIRTDLNF